MQIHKDFHKLKNILAICIIMLLAFFIVKPLHVLASSYTQHITVYAFSVTKTWDEYTEPEPVVVIMSYQVTFDIRYNGSITEETFPEEVQVYYGEDFCGTAVKTRLSNKTQSYTSTLNIPLRFSHFDETTRSETISSDVNSFSIKINDTILKYSDDSNQYYQGNGYSTDVRAFIPYTPVLNSTFRESAESSDIYKLQVDSPSVTSETVYDEDGDSITTRTISFTVTNSKKPYGNLELTAQKTENNTTPHESYTFCLLDAEGNILQTKQNDADGNIQFDPITYGEDDINREFIYRVVEQEGTDEWTIYDNSVYTVTVTPSLNPEDPTKIIAYPTITKEGTSVSAILFNNTVYDEQDYDIRITKTFGEHTDPEAIDVTIAYSGSFQLRYFGSGADADFPDTIQFYYGDVSCGTAEITQSGSGQESTSREYSYFLEIPCHFSSYDATGSETMQFLPRSLSLSFGDLTLNSGNHYHNGGYSIFLSDLIDLDAMGDSHFRETSGSGKPYVLSVSSSRSSAAQTSEEGDNKIVHTLWLTLTNSLPAGTLQITASKTVNHETPAQTYTFYLQDEDGYILQTKQNNTDGTIQFDPIPYSFDDIGKEHMYLIREQEGSDEQIIYDSSVYTVMVIPSLDPDDPTRIIASPTITREGTQVSAISFNNTLVEPEEVTHYDLAVTAAFDADTDPEAMEVTMAYSGSFSLQYVGSNANAAAFPDTISIYCGDVLCGTALKSQISSLQFLSTTQVQPYSFDLEIPFHFSSYDEDGSETIALLSEAFRLSFSGISLTSDNEYQDSGYCIELSELLDLDAMENCQFTETTQSGIQYDYTVSKTRSENTSQNGPDLIRTEYLHFTLTNSRKPAGSLQLTAGKTVNGQAPGQAYTFCLLDADGNVLQTEQNDADGTISFDPIAYGENDLGKEYTYQIIEQKGSDEKTTYDDSVYLITVKPTLDPEDGSVITAEPSITKNDAEVSEISFNNIVLKEEDSRQNPNQIPETGDPAEYLMWFVAAGAAAVCLFLGLRRKSQE